jgi:hypothetical protein
MPHDVGKASDAEEGDAMKVVGVGLCYVPDEATAGSVIAVRAGLPGSRPESA